MALFDLDPMDIATYAAQRRKAQAGYGQGLAQATYDQNMSQTKLTRDLGDVDQSYARKRENLPGQYARRGLMNSGIYQGALGRHAADQTQERQRALQSYQERLGQLEINKQNLGQNLNLAMTEIAEQEAARRAQIAAALRGLGLG